MLPPPSPELRRRAQNLLATSEKAEAPTAPSWWIAAAQRAIATPAQVASSGPVAASVPRRKAVAKWFGWISMPRGWLGLGLACAIFVGLVLINPLTFFSGPSRQSTTASGAWSAVAVSASTRAYGVAVGSGSASEANQAALTRCAAYGAGDCTVQLSSKAQCLALASPLGGAPVAAAGHRLVEAKAAALAACTRAGTQTCKIVMSNCGEQLEADPHAPLISQKPHAVEKPAITIDDK